MSFEAALAVAAVFVLMQWGVSRYSGWTALSERFPEPGTASVPPATRFGYLMFRGWFAYKGCVIVSGDEAGLHMRFWPPFSLFHPPVLIPWSEVSGVERARQFFIAHRRLRLRSLPDLDFALREGTYLDLAPAFRAAGVPGAE